MEWLIAIILAAAWRSLWGFAVYKLIVSKGYYENWFWWGFFFQLIALVVALIKPDISNVYPSEQAVQAADARKVCHDSGLLDSGGWQCRRCGRINPGYTGTCGCGMSRAGNDGPPEDGGRFERETANARAIRAYKELLDSGLITREEFEKKKAELLNIKE